MGAGWASPRYDAAEAAEDDAHRTAEIAVAVDPAWRHVSLATCLLRVLAEHAAKVGIRQFHAEFMADNLDVVDLLAESGLAVSDQPAEAGARTADITLPSRAR